VNTQNFQYTTTAVTVTVWLVYLLPVLVSGGDYVFVVVCLSVCLSVCVFVAKYLKNL